MFHKNEDENKKDNQENSRQHERKNINISDDVEYDEKNEFLDRVWDRFK